MVQHDEKKTTMKMLSVIVLHKGEGTTQLNLEEESMRGTWKVCRLKNIIINQIWITNSILIHPYRKSMNEDNKNEDVLTRITIYCSGMDELIKQTIKVATVNVLRKP